MNRGKRAQTIRETLFLSLGKRCVLCHAVEELTFDCIVPTGDNHHRMSSLGRAYYYRQMAVCGNLQVLCATCNRKKSDNIMPRYVAVRGT
jgi:hypothetical protein